MSHFPSDRRSARVRRVSALALRWRSHERRLGLPGADVCELCDPGTLYPPRSAASLEEYGVNEPSQTEKSE